MTPGRRLDRAALLAFAGALSLCAAAATAQTAAPAGAGAPARFGQPGAPLDVSADGTEVFQAERKVILTGRVEITQGQSRLRAPRVVMFYNPSNAVKGQPASAAPGAISRMEADGPVYFVTPTQSAKGDRGVYEAESDTVTLTGNVVVTQEKNVSTGDKLVIQQKTGQATMTGGPTSGRVRGVFYTKDKPPVPAGSPP